MVVGDEYWWYEGETKNEELNGFGRVIYCKGTGLYLKVTVGYFKDDSPFFAINTYSIPGIQQIILPKDPEIAR